MISSSEAGSKKQFMNSLEFISDLGFPDHLHCIAVVANRKPTSLASLFQCQLAWIVY